MDACEVDVAVWETVRRGDRAGTALGPDVVYARTGAHVSAVDLNRAVERLVAGGYLYWRSGRVRRRLLVGKCLEVPQSGVADVQLDLWGEGV